MPANDRFSRYISLVTFRRDGSSVATPVWYAAIGSKLYVFTDGTSYKVARLRRDQRIRVAQCGVGGTVTGPWHDGAGRIVTDAGLESRAYRALHAKYGWQMRLVDLTSRLAGRIGRRAILELELDD
jgi:hypothetical protein